MSSGRACPVCGGGLRFLQFGRLGAPDASQRVRRPLGHKRLGEEHDKWRQLTAGVGKVLGVGRVSAEGR
jgi:hypothetical protein